MQSYLYLIDRNVRAALDVDDNCVLMWVQVYMMQGLVSACVHPTWTHVYVLYRTYNVCNNYFVSCLDVFVDR